MGTQSTMMFSKLLTATDIKKRLAIPAKVLPFLPAFNGSHAVKVHLVYRTRTWPIVCTIRKKGYKKPVFSGGLWRYFVIGNKLNVGDRISIYKEQDSQYRVEVETEKPAASYQHGAAVSVRCSRKERSKGKQALEAPGVPMKQEGAIAELDSTR